MDSREEAQEGCGAATVAGENWTNSGAGLIFNL